MWEKCRLCLKLIPIESVIKLYYFLPETTEAAEKMVLLIAKYLQIKVKKDDIVSTTICQDCNDHLEDFHKFCEDIAAKQLALQNELLEVDLCTESPHFEDNTDEDLNSTCLLEEEVVENNISAAEPAMLECPIDVVKNELFSDKEDDDFCVQDMLKENTEARIKSTCLTEEEVVDNNISAAEHAMLECPNDVIKNEFVSDKEDDDFCVQDMLKEITEEQIKSTCPIELDSDKEDADFCVQDMLKADKNKNDAEEYIPPDDIQSSDDDMPLIQHKTKKKKTKKFTSATCSNKEKRDISKPKLKKEQQPKLSDQQLIATSFELKCDICHTQVSTWKELGQHFLLAAHMRIPYIKCCGTVYEKERPLVDHLQWHKNPDAFKCQLCEEKLKNSRDLTTHFSTAHPDNVDLLPQYECEHCFKQFRSFTIYKNHLRTHSKDRDVECHIRNKRYLNFAQMALTAAERQKRRRDKLKEEGKYEDYKRKNNAEAKKRRDKKRYDLAKLPTPVQNKVKTEVRENVRQRVKKCRALKCKASSSSVINPFKNNKPLGKAICRAKRSLPTSRRNMKTVIQKLFDDKIGQTDASVSQCITDESKCMAMETVNLVKQFYIEDDISRQAPDRKEVITLRNDDESKT